MEDFISLLQFHKLGGNVTCGVALEVGFKETALCGHKKKTKNTLFCLFFVLSHSFSSLLHH